MVRTSDIRQFTNKRMWTSGFISADDQSLYEQYAQALKEKGVEVKVMVFSKDTHAIDRPQSDLESFLNIGVWFNNYCK
ncbi:acylamino-acid-releasing enzyme-like [Nicotiana sylvestris]|uniref:acylamino-acid-releasing enzyme-like n=1 Tax=Nicotiana sylvestris TaxID=4096 RepID=UPI00388C6606